MARPRRHRRRPRTPPSPTTTHYPTSTEGEEVDDDPSLTDRRRGVSDDGEDADDEEGQTPTTATDASYSDSRRTGASATGSWRSHTEFTTPPTYVNVAPLPIFQGGPGECPVAHLRRFARVCRANMNAPSAEAMSRIFPVTLDGGAALWYELEVEPRPGLPWEAVQSSFLRAYCGPELAERSRSELMAMKQGPGEPVNAYYLRMQWILRKWPGNGIPDAMLRGIFLDGLREDYQDWIVPQQPQSLEEAFRLALSWELAQCARAARRRNPAADPVPPAGGGTAAKCAFCEGEHEEGACEVRRRMRELWLRSRERSQAKTAPALSSGGGESGTPSHGNFLSLSPSASMVRRAGEEGVGLLGFRRSQCQCAMHQCWKRCERSNSGLAEGNPSTAD